MGIFSGFSNKQRPKDVAKDRLRLILIHDRGDIPTETIDKMRNEILEVLSKYIEIQADDVEIAVTKSDVIEGDVASSLVANIPIKGVRGR
ncbi:MULTISPECIES: cell division topological specificity factor MinE [Clostridium]|uniref:Cell division topological specificity factor n=1 Tax=Clostridium cibarium TaxID=2762247 RepID=A0ABR8PR44_9CLOT|nr:MULTISPECIES: cell division topological specificity factor MinE [Clostridium]MBD7910651.1 cell division topological specificity factor MinE [Clostridium cibarium]